MLRRKRSAVLLRTEPDGTQIWKYQHKTLRVAPTHQGNPGQYSPFPSRAAFYQATGGKDWRPTAWFAMAVRERRQTVCLLPSVKPGPQSTIG